MPRVIPAGNGTDPWKMMQQYISETNRDTSQMRRQRHESDMLTQRLESAEQLQSERQANANMRLTVQEEGRNARFNARMAAQEGKARAALVGNKGIDAFINTLRENGVNNPYALSAIAAHIQRESGGNFGIINPNDKGKASGGGLQWRAERLSGLQSQRDWEDPRTQALYFLKEGNSTESRGFQRLMNAKSIEEANDAMTSIQRFDEEGLPNEKTERLRLAYKWGNKFAGAKAPSASEVATQEHDAAVSRSAPKTLEPGMYADESGRRYRVANYKPDILRKQQKTLARQAIASGDQRGINAADDWIVLDRNIPLDKKTGAFGYRVYIDPPNANNTMQTAEGGGGKPQAASVVVDEKTPPVKKNLSANAMPDDIDQDDDAGEDDDNDGV